VISRLATSEIARRLDEDEPEGHKRSAAAHTCCVGENVTADIDSRTSRSILTALPAANSEEVIAAPHDRDAPAERWYVGHRCPGGCRVVVVEGLEVHPLLARTRDPLWSFSWGRSGSSARELAWSVLYDSTHDPGLADDWCSAFTTEVISLLPRDAFRIASPDVLAWLSDERLAGATDRLLRRVLLQTFAANRIDERPKAVDATVPRLNRMLAHVGGDC
jgi:hypothetical protein